MIDNFSKDAFVNKLNKLVKTFPTIKYVTYQACGYPYMTKSMVSYNILKLFPLNDDDYYTITFTINTNQGGAGNYTLNDGNGDLGVFDYSVSNTLTLPADGQSFIFTFVDNGLNWLVQIT